MRNPTDEELRAIFAKGHTPSPFDRVPSGTDSILFDFESPKGTTFCLSSGSKESEDLHSVSEASAEIDKAVRSLKL